MDSKLKVVAVLSVPFSSNENNELLSSPAPETREKVRVAFASGSVALNSPTMAPIRLFSITLSGARLFKFEGGVLGTNSDQS